MRQSSEKLQPDFICLSHKTPKRCQLQLSPIYHCSAGFWSTAFDVYTISTTTDESQGGGVSQDIM